VVQYLDQDIILVDGMAQPSFSERKSTDPKYFRYEMLNTVNTTVMVENRVGYYKFYGKIMPKSQFLTANKLTIYPT
jgi:hypothetical protein